MMYGHGDLAAEVKPSLKPSLKAVQKMFVILESFIVEPINHVAEIRYIKLAAFSIRLADPYLRWVIT
jgi:hypothetical protein